MYCNLLLAAAIGVGSGLATSTTLQSSPAPFAAVIERPDQESATELFTRAAFPVVMAPSPVNSDSEESARQDRRARAMEEGDLTTLMDESTAAELAKEFGTIGDEATFQNAAATTLVKIDVNVTTQRMVVTTPQGKLGPWKVSTAGHGTTNLMGTHAIDPTRMHEFYRSRKYKGSPMPFTLFYVDGFAVHGTDHVGALGRPDSMGCVRLHPKNAEKLFRIVEPLVKTYGLGTAIVSVHY